MALKLLQPGLQPIGQFDGKDSEFLTLLGGEVVSLTGADIAGTDKAAYDAFDGYAGTTTHFRPVVTKTLTSGMRPLMLADDGTSGYGTLFGQVVGGTVGQVTAGAVVGPHTATGSGKVTCWDKAGLYAVTLDAVDTTGSTGLTVTNTTLAVGAALYATAAGLLTPNSAASFETVKVGTFIEFGTGGSLVTTPNYLVAGFASPSSSVSSLQPKKFTVAIFHFNPTP